MTTHTHTQTNNTHHSAHTQTEYSNVLQHFGGSRVLIAVLSTVITCFFQHAKVSCEQTVALLYLRPPSWHEKDERPAVCHDAGFCINWTRNVQAFIISEALQRENVTTIKEKQTNINNPKITDRERMKEILDLIYGMSPRVHPFDEQVRKRGQRLGYTGTEVCARLPEIPWRLKARNTEQGRRDGR